MKLYEKYRWRVYFDLNDLFQGGLEFDSLHKNKTRTACMLCSHSAALVSAYRKRRKLLVISITAVSEKLNKVQFIKCAIDHQNLMPMALLHWVLFPRWEWPFLNWWKRNRDCVGDGQLIFHSLGCIESCLYIYIYIWYVLFSFWSAVCACKLASKSTIEDIKCIEPAHLEMPIQTFLAT